MISNRKDKYMKRYCYICGFETTDDSISECPRCLCDDVFVCSKDEEELLRLLDNRELVNAMLKLKQEDIIEYQLKLNQFKTQIQEQKAFEEKQQESKKPHCPTCGSTNIGRLVGFAQDGDLILGGTRRFFYCNNCGYEW